MVVTIIIFQGLIFLGLIFVLRNFMKGHVTGAVSHLQKMNDELMKQQDEFKKKIADADKEYQTKTAKLEREIAERQAKAREEMNQSLEDSKKKAQEERERIINEAVETREKMRQEVMAEMEEKAITYSADIIGRFFSPEMKRLIHDYLVREVAEGIREVNMDNYQIEGDQAVLTSAMSLSDENKKTILKVLKEKTKKEIKLDEKTDGNLVCGIILKVGTFVIDGSLNNRLKESTSQMQRETARRYQSAG